MATRYIVASILILAVCVLVVYLIIPNASGNGESTGHASGDYSDYPVQEEPIQTSIDNPRRWKRGAYRITPLAAYQIRAKVLSIEYYQYGREANLAPVDFALGWGPMSDESITDHFTIVQHDRWCSWKTKRSPIPMSTVLLHSANVHMIPKDKVITRQLGDVSVGNIITIKGKLIEATGSDGWTWTSSLSRNDQGEQSCEIIWVESLSIEPKQSS
jgi:hypothetical protein